jgi:hypothetical protein
MRRTRVAAPGNWPPASQKQPDLIKHPKTKAEADKILDMLGENL